MPSQTASPGYRLFKLIKHTLFNAPLDLLGGHAKLARHWVGRFHVNRYSLSFPHWPAALDGLTITHLSDLHLGRCFNAIEHLPSVLEACQRLDSDLICMTGDWVDEDAALIHPLIERLQTLRPRLGWFGVIGNHDVYDSREEVVGALRAWIGSHLLINSAVDVPIKDHTLRIMGLDYAPDHKGELADATLLDRTLPPATPDFTLGLCHHPRGFDSLRQRGASLTLCGHTHGGQFSLSHAPLPAISPFQFQFPYLRGFYEKEGARLYVSVGTGQGFPIRIGNTPEIAQFTLRRT